MERLYVLFLFFFHFWTAVRNVLPKVKYQLWFLPAWTQPLSFLLFLFLFVLFWRFFVLSPCSRGKTRNLCLLQWENASFLFSVKFYGTDLYNFKSSYFSIHAEYSSITTKKHVKKIRLKKKKCYSITLIFSEHCTVALLCASISEAKKNFEINALFIKWHGGVCGRKLCGRFLYFTAADTLNERISINEQPITWGPRFNQIHFTLKEKSKSCGSHSTWLIKYMQGHILAVRLAAL